MGKIIYFFHPVMNVLLSAEYDSKRSILIFDCGLLPNSKLKESSKDRVNATVQWCEDNRINCKSIQQANNHLTHLGIKEHFK